jgi:hypothetical protein
MIDLQKTWDDLTQSIAKTVTGKDEIDGESSGSALRNYGMSVFQDAVASIPEVQNAKEKIIQQSAVDSLSRGINNGVAWFRNNPIALIAVLGGVAWGGMVLLKHGKK